MKKLLFLCICAILSVNLNAQRSFNNHNVITLNDLNQEQTDLSLKRAQNTISTGSIFFVTGVASAIVGIILYHDPAGSEKKKETGEYMTYAGSGLAAIGIPVMIIGNIKKKDIELKLLRLQGSGSINGYGAGLKIRF